MTDSQGRTVNFKNAIIILTSNLGSGALLEAELQGGHEGAREMVMAAVRSHFRPEFVNRIDEFVVFDPLRMDQIKGIVKLQVGGAALRAERACAHGGMCTMRPPGATFFKHPCTDRKHTHTRTHTHTHTHTHTRRTPPRSSASRSGWRPARRCAWR